MPKLTGTQFLQQLKTHPTVSQIPVILTSAKLNINDLNNYKDLGVINIINKPFDPNIIHKTVLNSWLNYNKTKLNKY
jgi:response regulator RpfG family c-di-GMP phosphodiesterase